MAKSKFLRRVLPALIVLLMGGIVVQLMSCDTGKDPNPGREEPGGEIPGGDNPGGNIPIPAQTPQIIVQPQSDSYFTQQTIAPLSVTASVADGGTLSYQWYKAASNSDVGTAINSAAAATYQPVLNEIGRYYYYYYVVVTNTNNNATGNKTAQTKSSYAVITIYNQENTNANATVTLNSATKYQYVRGFGGTDITWSGFYEIKMSEYEEMYNPDKLGYNMMRIVIEPGIKNDDANKTSTYTTHADWITDVMENGNRPNYINAVKLVNKYGGYVLASPWTPPSAWKSNGIVAAQPPTSGGYLLPEYYDEYAAYLKDYATYMGSQGAPIYAVSIQNEPNYAATYDGCVWSANQMRDFFKTTGVGNFTNGVAGYGGGAATPRVLIMNGESAETPAIHNAALADPASRGYIDLLARHNYGSISVQYAYNADPDAAPRYGKEMWMTEYNINSGNETAARPNDHTWNYVWPFMNDVDITIRQRNENAYIWYALKRFYSFIGDGQHGATEGAILPRGYALSHYAKFAKEKTRINVAVTGTLADGTAINATNVNNTNIDRINNAAKVSAYLSDDGNELSVVMYTPTGNDGTGGFDLGIIKIDMPAGFEIGSASGIRSYSNVYHEPYAPLIANDRRSAYVILPRSHIISVKFTK